MREGLPELPWERRVRYSQTLGLKDEDAEFFVVNRAYGDFFDTLLSRLEGKEVQSAVNYLTTDLPGIARNEEDVLDPFAHLTPDAFVKLMKMKENGTLNSSAVSRILLELIKQGGNPEEIANRLGLVQNSDPEALRTLVQGIIEQYPQQVADYHAGKEALMKFFVGMAMKETKGSANPKVVTELFEEELLK